MPAHMSPQKNAKAKAPRGGSRRPWVVPVAIVGVTAAVYLGGVAVFSNVFMPQTRLNGQDVSLMPGADAAALAEGPLSSYSFRVTGDGLDLTVTADKAGLSRDGQAMAAKALAAQGAWTWPLGLAGSRDLEVECPVTADESKLEGLIASAAQAAAEADPGEKDIAFDEASGTYVLSDAALAAHIDAKAAAAHVTEALADMPQTIALGDESLSGGSELHDALTRLNAYVGATQALTLGGNQAATVDAARIAGWLSQGDDGSVTLNTQAIADWCHGELSDQLDSVGTERTYTRPDGKVVTVSGGIYGWCIDGGALAEQIAAALEAGAAGSIEIPCTSSAATVNPHGQDWSARYIDVDRTEQHARFYGDDGSIIWESDVVTGQPNKGHDTPAGVWSITSREHGDINLRGPVGDDGEPEWDSHVQYWMGVVGSAVGFHNAPWRSQFGGNIYTWYGSHGCINLSMEKADELYNVIQVGDVCIVHD